MYAQQIIKQKIIPIVLMPQVTSPVIRLLVGRKEDGAIGFLDALMIPVC